MTRTKTTADEALGEWLAQQFRALSSVRRCRIQPHWQQLQPSEYPPLLAVDTWMQATLFVYPQRHPPTVRELRRLLNHNTRAGVGTVVLLHRGNFPEQPTMKIPSWLLALHSLSHERLFTFEESAPSFTLDRLHLIAHGPAGVSRLLWRCDVTFQRLAVIERVIRHGPLRGRWLSAELDCENQKEDYAAAARARRAPQHRLDPFTRESFSLLGLSASASDSEIRQAFRRLARETHPDVSDLPHAEAEARFRRIQVAYQHILNQQSDRQDME